MAHSLILLCFEAAWTLLFTTGYMLWVLDGAVYQLANVASSVIWLLLTAILWVRSYFVQSIPYVLRIRHRAQLWATYTAPMSVIIVHRSLGKLGVDLDLVVC